MLPLPSLSAALSICSSDMPPKSSGQPSSLEPALLLEAAGQPLLGPLGLDSSSSLLVMSSRLRLMSSRLRLMSWASCPICCVQAVRWCRPMPSPNSWEHSCWPSAPSDAWRFC